MSVLAQQTSSLDPAPPEAGPLAPGAPEPTLQRAYERLFGLAGRPRYQLFPEKVLRTLWNDLVVEGSKHAIEATKAAERGDYEGMIPETFEAARRLYVPGEAAVFHASSPLEARQALSFGGELEEGLKDAHAAELKNVGAFLKAGRDAADHTQLTINNLKKLGKKLGGGAYGDVYINPDDPNQVLKVFINKDQAYNRYLNMIAAKTNNPHFPKIEGAPMPFDKDQSIIKMERLQPFDSQNPDHVEKYRTARNYLKALDYLYNELTDYKSVGNPPLPPRGVSKDQFTAAMKDLVNATAQREPLLADALDTLHREVIRPPGVGRQAPWLDLHHGNIMFRDDGTLVITDPVAGHKASAAEISAEPKDLGDMTEALRILYQEFPLQ